MASEGDLPRAMESKAFSMSDKVYSDVVLLRFWITLARMLVEPSPMPVKCLKS